VEISVSAFDKSYLHRDMIDIRELNKALNKLEYLEFDECFEKFKQFKGLL